MLLVLSFLNDFPFYFFNFFFQRSFVHINMWILETRIYLNKCKVQSEIVKSEIITVIWNIEKLVTSYSIIEEITTFVSECYFFHHK